MDVPKLTYDLNFGQSVLRKMKIIDNNVYQGSQLFYYIQYAHARIVSLEEKFLANYPSVEKDIKSIESNSYNECDKLIHEISRYPDVVKKSASSLQPHLIIYYLRDLSQLLHSYYNDNHVLSESEENMKAIVQCLSSVRQVISNGLNLLGISPMNKM